MGGAVLISSSPTPTPPATRSVDPYPTAPLSASACRRQDGQLFANQARATGAQEAGGGRVDNGPAVGAPDGEGGRSGGWAQCRAGAGGKKLQRCVGYSDPPPGPLSFRAPSSMAAKAACVAPVQSTRLTEPHRYHSHNAPLELPPPMYNKRLRGWAPRNFARVFFISIACDIRQYDSRQIHD